MRMPKSHLEGRRKQSTGEGKRKGFECDTGQRKEEGNIIGYLECKKRTEVLKVDRKNGNGQPQKVQGGGTH